MATSTRTETASLADRRRAPHTRAADRAGASTGTIPHLRPLDGLRGVAVLAVVVYHFTPEIAPGGFLGVDVFFVLSGFLITSLLVAERETTGHTALRQFWIRRARRLFPALILVLLAVGAWGILKATPLEVDRLRGDGLAAIGYFANWRFIVSGQSYIEEFVGLGPSPLRHTWSLAIEEQFYLVWPLVVAGIGVLLVRRARRSGRPATSLRRVLVVTCLALAAASVVVMALLHAPGEDPSRVYYGTDTRAHLLLVGAALGAATAGILTVADEMRRRLLVGLGIVAGAGLVAAMLLVDATDTWLYEAGYGGIAIAVALIIASAAQPGRNPIAALLGTRPLVGLGLISYGVYLWHWPIAVWLDEESTGLDGVALFALRSALTLGVALLSYRLVEMPIRRGALARRNPLLPKVLAPFAVVLAIVVLMLPTWGVARLDDNVETAAVTSVGVDAVAAEYSGAPRCDEQPSSTESTSPVGERTSVELYGNSVADEVAACLRTIMKDRGVELGGLTQPGSAPCDFLPVLEERMVEQPPDAVVLYMLPVSLSPCTQGLDGEALLDLWERDMRRTVEVMVNADVGVYLVAPVPQVGSSVESPLASIYRELAASDPSHVRVLDAGTYLRDSVGTSQSSMPCVGPGELGCDGGRVNVRNPVDGMHLCSDASWSAGACAPEFAAGQRRAAAAIGAQLLQHLDAGSP